MVATFSLFGRRLKCQKCWREMTERQLLFRELSLFFCLSGNKTCVLVAVNVVWGFSLGGWGVSRGGDTGSCSEKTSAPDEANPSRSLFVREHAAASCCPLVENMRIASSTQLTAQDLDGAPNVCRGAIISRQNVTRSIIIL